MSRPLHTLLGACLLTGCVAVQPAGQGGGAADKADPATDVNVLCGFPCYGAEWEEIGQEECERREQCRRDHERTLCRDRRNEALSSERPAYGAGAIRWSCADVDGVTGPDRGQEYCEYYAVAVLPPAEDGVEPPVPATFGQDRGTDLPQTAPGVEVTRAQRDALEAEPWRTVGQCVFTAWQAELDRTPAGCAEGSCPELALGDEGEIASWIAPGTRVLSIDAEHLRMKRQENERFAAVELLDWCLAPGPLEHVTEQYDDDFFRGCMSSLDFAITGGRKSEARLCASATRLAALGCGIDADRDGTVDVAARDCGAFTDIDSDEAADEPCAMAQALNDGATPREEFWGFPLGTWSDPDGVPARCELIPVADGVRIAVRCDITANDLLRSASDIKEFCRMRYGTKLVVHVPVAEDAIVCERSDGAPPWIPRTEG